MTAIRFDGYGGPEVLVPEQRACPQPAPRELLVRIAAAGVNRVDVLQRGGGYPPPPGASDIPGLEFAGEVVATGADTSRFRAGDRVCALVGGGGYAQYAVVDESNALPVPRGLSLEQAGGLPETFFTVWMSMFDCGRLVAGETVLIHGGASGIGTTAIQLAKAFGARVIVTAGSDDKCRVCRELGADVAINYKTQDFVAATIDATAGRGAGLVIDIVAADYVNRNFDAAAEHGRIVQVGLMHGPNAEINVLKIMFKRLHYMGSSLRPRSIAEKAAVARALEAQVWPLLESGRIRPVIDKTFALEHAADAHRRIDSGQHIGKIMLTPAAA